MEGIIFIIVTAGVAFIIKSYFNKPRYDQEYFEMLEDTKEFNETIELYRKAYFTHYNKTILINKYQETYNYFSKKIYRKSKEPNILNFKNTFTNIHNLVYGWNYEYIKKELIINKTLL